MIVVNNEHALGPEEWARLAESMRREIKEQTEALCRAYRIGFLDALKVGDEPEPVRSMSGVDLTRGIWESQ